MYCWALLEPADRRNCDNEVVSGAAVGDVFSRLARKSILTARVTSASALAGEPRWPCRRCKMSAVQRQLIVLLAYSSLLASGRTLGLTNETAKMLGEIVDEVMRNEHLPSNSKSPPAVVRCGIHGTLNKNSTCDCSHLWTGELCNTIVCLNGGVPNASFPLACDCRNTEHFGSHCELAVCRGGQLSADKQRCDCMDNRFGAQCQFICWHGRVDANGRCVCEDGNGLSE